MAGCIGEGPGAEFVGFLRIYRDLPDVDGILKDPSKGTIPREPAILYALCGALVERCRQKKGQDVDAGLLSRFVQYIGRLPDEYSVLAVRDATQVAPTIFRVPGMSDWNRKHKEVFGIK